MSHNKIKVAGQEPDATGAVSVALDNLSDVNITSIANNDFLQYNSTSGDWENSASASSSTVELVFLGEGASNAYPETLANGNDVYFYAPNPVNNIAGASLSSSDTFTDWYDQVSLPAGNYLVQAALRGDYTGATGEAKFTFRDSSLRGAAGVDLDASNTTGTAYPGDAIAYLTLSSTTTVTVRLSDVTAANSTTSNVQSERGYLLIMKVG